MLVLKDMLVLGSIRGAATTHRTDTQVGATMAARAITIGVLGILTGDRRIPIMATIHPGRLRRMDTIHMEAMGAIRIPTMGAMPTATRTTSRGTRITSAGMLVMTMRRLQPCNAVWVSWATMWA